MINHNYFDTYKLINETTPSTDFISKLNDLMQPFLQFKRKEKFAKRVAAFMHMGQVDKAGDPYINHVTRVAHRVTLSHTDNRTAILAAWLHDTVEDTPLTLTAIRAEFGKDVANVVSLLTKTPDKDMVEYVQGIKSNSDAFLIKLADIRDNNDPVRLSKLTPKEQSYLKGKYEYMLSLLLDEN